MKKYKLIKEYPNGPKLGTIIDSRTSYWGYDSKTVVGIVVFMNPNHPKDHPEYWQEVVEKDYEILSFVNNGKANGIKGFIVPLQKDGLYYAKGYPKAPDDPDESLEGCLKKSCLDIHSIKRLSDGEIFTIGDIIKNGNHTSNILQIFIKDNELLYSTKFTNCANILNNCNKVKQPLFTTEDGVDIFEGDKYYPINFSHLTGDEFIASEKSMNHNGKPFSYRFSTKEKAKEYLDFNKIQYSKQDVFNIIHKGFDKRCASTLGKHKILSFFDIGPLPREKQKLFTIEEIEVKLENYFKTWNSKSEIDRNILINLLKQ